MVEGRAKRSVKPVDHDVELSRGSLASGERVEEKAGGRFAAHLANPLFDRGIPRRGAEIFADGAGVCIEKGGDFSRRHALLGKEPVAIGLVEEMQIFAVDVFGQTGQSAVFFGLKQLERARDFVRAQLLQCE